MSKLEKMQIIVIAAQPIDPASRKRNYSIPFSLARLGEISPEADGDGNPGILCVLNHPSLFTIIYLSPVVKSNMGRSIDRTINATTNPITRIIAGSTIAVRVDTDASTSSS